MKFETLRNNRKILLGTVIVFVVILTLIITTSLAKYKVTESINIATGTINYSPSDISLMGIYLESEDGYTQVDAIPESGYELNSEESYCKVGDSNTDVTINYDTNTQALSISPMTSKGTKCYLYFDVKPITIQDILASKTISERTDFSTTLKTDTTGTVYSAADDDGTSYYFAGAPTDNWIKFAGMYWRIIRVNGDGSIRMIYQGTSANTTGTGTQLSSTSTFNSSYDNNAYVGFIYTLNELHGLGTSSTIKGVLDTWYTSNLANYASYIDTNAGFCGDRTPSTSSSSSNGSGGTGTTTTYYGDNVRYNNSGAPTLKCANSNDLYTVNNSSKGNKALTNPVGLINMNEVWMAGATVAGNSIFYLYTGKTYWTLSPSSFNGSAATVFRVYSTGGMTGDGVRSGYGVRPVINLRSDTKFKRSTLGTADSPYEVI